MQLNAAARSGFTLGELIVALALLGLLITLFLHTLVSHQKVFRNLRERIFVSEQLREGELALIGDIRGTAITADTLRLLSDSAFEFFATMGSTVICTVGTPIVTLVPVDLSSGLLLSSIPLPPDTGDLLSAYTRPDSISGNRSWIRYRISAVSTAPASSACPATAGFTGPADASKPAFRISVVGSVSELMPGAPARILRRGRYSLYKSSDGNWFLGYKRCNAVTTGCSAIQPVSGPYLPYSAATGGGLRFRYLDSLGLAVPSTRPLAVAALEITIRSEVGATGRIGAHQFDSVLVLVTPRNLH